MIVLNSAILIIISSVRDMTPFNMQILSDIQQSKNQLLAIIKKLILNTKTEIDKK